MVFFSVILIILIVMFIFITRVVSKHQRFVLFNIGKYQGLKGPGLVFKWPWSANYWLRITVGDQGELIKDDLGKFNGLEIPIESIEKIKIGSKIRVIGFTENKIQIDLYLDPNQVER